MWDCVLLTLLQNRGSEQASPAQLPCLPPLTHSHLEAQPSPLADDVEQPERANE